MLSQQKIIFQRIWGVLLILAGVGVFFRVEQVMPRIDQFPYFLSIRWFIRFSFYLMGVILVGGGVKKLYDHFFKPERKSSE